MTLLIKACEDVVSLVDTYRDKILSCIRDKNKQEFYVSNSSLDKIGAPYLDIEQALDDFEYLTKKLPNSVILAFKDKVYNRVTKTSAIQEDFKIICEDEICSLKAIKDNCQLIYFPISFTNSGEPEFSILSLDFEPIKDYEVLEDSFTEEVDEALRIFEEVVGELPLGVIKEFKQEIKTLENSENKTFIQELEEGIYCYFPSDKISKYQLTYDKENDLLFFDYINDAGEVESEEFIFKDFTPLELLNKLRDLYADLDTIELKKVLLEFDKLAEK